MNLASGVLTMNANGTFSFAPSAGFTGTQTFTYTLRDAGLDDVASNADDLTGTGTVTIDVTAPKVWYVDNTYAGANGASDGTALRPFTSLNALNGGTGDGTTNDDVDGANDIIYVKGTGTNYTSGIVLEAGQQLIGSGEALVVNGVTLAAVGTAPVLSAAAGQDVVVLDDGNTVAGLTIDPQGAANGIAGGTGDDSGTIRNVSITDTGTAGTQASLELDGTTGTFNISNLVINNSTATGQTSGSVGVLLNNAGTVNFASAGTISITTAGAKALSATGTSMGTSVFDDIAVTGSGSGAISMSNTTGSTTFGDGLGTDLSLTTTSGPSAFLLNNAGNVTVAAAGTSNVSATGGAAVDATGGANGTYNLAFDNVDSRPAPARASISTPSAPAPSALTAAAR